MKTRLAICLAFAALSPAALPVSASAQALLPPYEITTSVRSMGLEPISPPVRRGARYVLRAIDRRGAEVAVAADALSGRVLFVRPVGYGRGPVVAERFHPPAYPEEFAPPRGYERQRSYEPRRSYEPPGNPGNYEQQGNYEPTPPRNPPDPSVIYAPRENATAPQPPARAPSAAKPPAPPKVAAKPAAKPAATAETTASRQQSDATTGTIAPQPPAENPAAAIPPVQSLE
ncbi:MAG TPA: hypothetical protein VFK79_10585 [Xanthobacteraceae bacterium]|nr:hypothetical protein [Xanthobacteraceae bacterium]